MGFDVFCAVCGGPVSAYIRIAQESRIACFRERGEKADSDFSDSGFDFDNEQFDGYDPETINEGLIEWTVRSGLLLGFNPKSTAIGKAYITGPARYEDYGCFGSVEPGDDPNFPHDSDEFQCYNVYDATQTRCFPIHQPCLKILARALCGNDNIENLDKDILYQIISTAQMMVINPLVMPDFTRLLRSTVSTDDFALPPPPERAPDLEARIRHDPFATLPYDITHNILLHLPSASVRALCTASYPVHSAFPASNRNFWRQALRACMPWFWELHALMRHGTVDPATTDHKGLFLWLDGATTPRRGLSGPFMGIANRRRVWGVCDQLAALYAPRVALRDREHEQGSEARAVWDGAVNVGLPLVCWPMPDRDLRAAGVAPVLAEDKWLRTSVAQWACGFADWEHGGVVEAVWDDGGTLVGIAFTSVKNEVVGERKCFGKSDAASKETVEVKHWIAALVLHMPDIFLEEEQESSIKGITVRTVSGEVKHLGDTSQRYCQRVLSVTDNHTIIGIAGHLTSTGRITRLGLVQRPSVNASAPPSSTADDEDDEPTLPHLFHPLWKPPSPSSASPLHTPTAPIWTHHPRLRALASTERPLRRYQIQSNYHDDTVPTDVLIWGATAAELQSLRRISAYKPGGEGMVGCVRAEFSAQSGIAARTVGEPAARRLLVEDDFPADGGWLQFWTTALEIDGEGGERVVAVDAVHDEDIKAVRLRTNRGRDVVWGKPPGGSPVWESMRPDEGETIVGLALGFTYRYHYRGGKKHYSCVEMNSVSALTMAL
ncbi:hypothetical protein C8J57DRAFT_125102 [Neofusicoccum parvum]|uniref:Uncharacterized protein n=1 Tax=Neofusicoccum parvum TaxID=310453 RepID=A0ACB5S143_9PEZI|nr:hypothetical protein C8J57DRAFT_125102 [Neofusicoccum parvum]